MSYFKAKVHQIRFRPAGVLPQTPLQELTVLSRSLTGFERATSNGREGWKDGSEGQGKETGKGRA